VVKNKFKSIRTLQLILSFLILHLSATGVFFTANATVRYVSHSGNNTPPYLTWATAADSIVSAINISVFGDTIYVANGVYKERIDMIPGLTLIGAGMDSCVIDTREFLFASGFYSVRVSDSCYLASFQIITFDNTHGFGIYVLDWNIEFVSAIIEYNKIVEAKGGINISTSSLGFDNDNKLIRMNIIMNAQDGITSFQTAPIIKENIIYTNEDGLVSQIISSPNYVGNTIIFNNVFGLRGFADFGGSNSILKNNLFYGKGAYGFWSYGDTIINNVVFSQSGNWGVGILGAGSDIRNNNIQNTGTGLYYVFGTIKPTFRTFLLTARTSFQIQCSLIPTALISIFRCIHLL